MGGGQTLSGSAEPLAADEKLRDARASVAGPLVRADDGAAAHLRALGLPGDATWEQVNEAHRRLVSDLTPGPDASHQNVQLAEQFLHEVNQAYASLRILAVA